MGERSFCNAVYAHALLQEGQTAQARALFESAFVGLRYQLDEAAIYCLERLANPAHGMDQGDNVMCWAGVFLASAMKSKNQLAITKALTLIGDIFLTDKNDPDTAITLFEVSQHAFMQMGVYLWEGECMVRLASILEARGQVGQTIQLLHDARPLFEKSNQSKKLMWLDNKCAQLTAGGEPVPKKYEGLEE
ncbi:hypothetical protein C8F01DRAFT_1077947 [Mycena amicta]|nr:hypothetical protein C8F01DRAFT_1077947 [Mycena amicta]